MSGKTIFTGNSEQKSAHKGQIPRELNPRPPIKWAGGKSQLLARFKDFFPAHFDLYIEPFLGGGAVFFHLLPLNAVLIDNNEELINLYQVIRDDLEKLLSSLEEHQNTAEYFYKIRALNPQQLAKIERASRFLYLNKTAYNGLYRVNKQNKFNVPFGYYQKPRIKDEENLRQVQYALKNAAIILGDFTLALHYAKKAAFVYLDPPYQPLSKTANFTGYTSEGFDEDSQVRLAELFYQLDKEGCLVMLSNSDTPFIRNLYEDYFIDEVFARRSVNSKADKRGAISELIIRNYQER